MSKLKSELAYHWWRLCHNVEDSRGVSEMVKNLDAEYWQTYERAADRILLLIEVIGARLVTDLDRPHSLASTHKWFAPETLENAPAKALPAKPAKAAQVRKYQPPKAWTPEDIEKLTDIITAGNYTNAEVAEKMGRTIGSISGAISMLKRGKKIGGKRAELPQRRSTGKRKPQKKGANHWARYTPEEVESLKEMIERGWTNKEIARKVGRTTHSISIARWKLQNNRPLGPKKDKNP